MRPINLFKPCLIAASLLFAACSDDPVIAPENGDDSGDNLFSISCISRAETMSRADGVNVNDPIHNGHDTYGLDNENIIEDAMIVIYKKPINYATESDKVVAVVKLSSNDLGQGAREYGVVNLESSYYDNNGNPQRVTSAFTFTRARTYAIKDITALNRLILNTLNPNTTYYAMAFANFGNDLQNPELTGGHPIEIGRSLTDLRNLVYTGDLFYDNSGYYPNNQEVDASYTGSKEYDSESEKWYALDASNKRIPTGYGVHREYGKFRMSAVNEVKFTTPPANAVGGINLGDFYVQRLAARVDICFGVQATAYADYTRNNNDEYNIGGDGNKVISWSYLHYADMKWREGERIDSSPSEDVPANWLGMYKFDMDVPSASPTGYPPDGLYRFPIFSENEYQSAKTALGKDPLIDGNPAWRIGHAGEPTNANASKTNTTSEVWFWLENIEILNCVESGEYLLEHSVPSSTPTSTSPVYMGSEGSWTNGYPDRFIQSYADRTIADRNLTPEPDGSPTKSSITLRDEDRVKVRPVPYIMSRLAGTDDAKKTIQEYHRANASDAKGVDYERKFHVSSILGYVGENTFTSYSDDNQYTTIRLKGKFNIAELNADPSQKYQEGTVELRLRHSFGATNTGHPLCWGVVRNTIYKVFLRFFGEGDDLYVRYWWYDGSNRNITDHNYDFPNGTSKFTRVILESNGEQPVDAPKRK